MDLFNFERSDIPHYYGDLVRQLFVAAAVVFVVGDALFGGHLLPLPLYAQVCMVIVLVLLAALTSPHGKLVMLANAIVAALGVFMFEVVAIGSQASEQAMLFLLQELIALFLLFALYFSIKTLRAFAAGQLGRWAPPNEFDER